jgi:hypothetical protein
VILPYPRLLFWLKAKKTNLSNQRAFVDENVGALAILAIDLASLKVTLV